MQEMVARLIACGVPREVAVCVCKHFKRRGDLELVRYVEAVEDESHVGAV